MTEEDFIAERLVSLVQAGEGTRFSLTFWRCLLCVCARGSEPCNPLMFNLFFSPPSS